MALGEASEVCPEITFVPPRMDTRTVVKCLAKELLSFERVHVGNIV